MNEVYCICSFIWTAVRGWVTFDLLSSLAEPKREERTELLIKGIVTILIAGFELANYLTTETLFSNLLVAICAVAIALTGCGLYRIHFGQSIIVSYLFWVFIAYIDFFVQALFYITVVEVMGQKAILLWGSIERGLYLLICSCGIIGTRSILRKWLPIIVKEFRCNILVGLGIIIGSFVLMMYLQGIYLYQMSIQYMAVWIIFITISVIFVSAIVGYYVQQRHKLEGKIHQEKLGALWSGYQQMASLYQEKSTLLHDEKNHLLAIRCYLENDERQKAIDYLNDLSFRLQQKNIQQITGHEFLDMILSLKKQQAEQEGISVEFTFDCISDVKMSDFETCALFTNLLDNAIEANMALFPEQEKWIRLIGRRHGSMLSIKMENPIKAMEGHELGKILKTRKDGHYHGFGLKSIQGVVDNYEGHMECSSNNNVFLQTIFLCCL